jgi:sec-independent protein translocase protein TatA
MGGIGFPELMVIAVIALLVFGPKRLPEAGKALGQAIRDFKASMEGKDDVPTRSKGAQALLSCPDCGKSVEANAAFCAHCRSTLAGGQRDQAVGHEVDTKEA